VTHTYIQAIEQPTLHYLTRSVRRRAATSKRTNRALEHPGRQTRLILVQSRAAMAKKISWRTGAGLAVAAFVLTALFVATNHFDRFPLAANESSAVGSLRTLYFANIAYAKDHPEDGYAKKLIDLSSRSDKPVQHNGPEWMIDPALVGGLKTGYRFGYASHSSKGDGKVDAYELSADPLEPGQFGKRHFFMNETGVIRVSETGPANASDPALH
jgi:type IV pilus assembly protein PilA